MGERLGVIILMLGSSCLMIVSILKGVDDWQSQNLRNQLTEFKKDSDYEHNKNAKLDAYVIPSSHGPFMDHQAYGLYYSWLSFQEQDRTLKIQFSEKSVKQFKLQQRQSPLDSSVVINKANQMWRDGVDFRRVLIEFHRAQKIGYYEPFTVVQSLKYYLAHWPDLSLSEKKQVISYLLDHKKYKMQLWQYDSILKLPIIGDRACNILSFNDIVPYHCRN